MFAILGSTTVDVFVRSPRGLPQVDGDEFTSTSLVFCDEPLQFSPGGNACNCAYVLASLGAETVLCSAVGEDELGRMMVGWLDEVGVGRSALKQRPSDSTSSTTIINAGSSRLSFHHAGALSTYDPTDIPRGVLTAADVLLVCAYPLLKRWRPDGYRDLLRDAHEHGVTTALDIGPTVGRAVTTEELRPLLPDVDYFLCNSLELQRCTGTEELGEGMRLISSEGVFCVVTKLGPRGAAVLVDDEPEYVEGFSVEEHGTVGAGDSFNAGFLFARRAGYGLVEAARFGNAVASMVVAAPSGVRCRPVRAQVDGLMHA